MAISQICPRLIMGQSYSFSFRNKTNKYIIFFQEKKSFFIWWNQKNILPLHRQKQAGVAQLVERQPSKLNVASSNLVSRSLIINNLYLRK